MKVLVTGSAGFIGFHLARRLLDDGHAVAGIDAMVPYYDVAAEGGAARPARPARAGFRPHIVDLADAAGWPRSWPRRRRRWSSTSPPRPACATALEHPASYIHTNSSAPSTLLEACRRRPVAAPADGLDQLGLWRQQRDALPRDDAVDTPLTIYAATKMATEAMGHSYAASLAAADHHVPLLHGLRPLGPAGHGASSNSPTRSCDGRPIDIYNHGQMERDFTYVDDLVEAIPRLIPCVPEAGRAGRRRRFDQPGRALPGGQHRQCAAGAAARLHRRDRARLRPRRDPQLHGHAARRGAEDLGEPRCCRR